jgi:hypothetical protein
MDTDATSPVDGGDTSAEDTAGVDTEVDTQETEPEQQFDDDGNPIETEPDEDEEVELDDLKIKVPKDAAQKVREAMLRQADYTKKTQEVAELRKALEADRSNLRETSDAELGAAAQATAIAQQLAAYQRVDWGAWNDSDPFEAQKAFMQFQQLKDAQQNALGQLQHLRNDRLSKAQQEAARRMEEGRKTLATHIPGWNDDHKAKLIGFAAEYGFSRDELDDLEADPRVARVLHEAFTGREASRKQQQAQRHVTAQQAQPAAVVRARTAPPAGLDDRLSIDEWNKRREAQVAKKGR